MSCIATFSVLPLTKRDAFLFAKQNEIQVKVHKTWFSTTIKEIGKELGKEYLWQYLKREAAAQYDLPYSGFLIVDYLFTFHEQCIHYFETIDDYYSVLDENNAKLLSAFLINHPPDRTALIEFCRESKVDPDEELIDGYQAVHEILVKWCSLVSTDSFGVLHLSF